MEKEVQKKVQEGWYNMVCGVRSDILISVDQLPYDMITIYFESSLLILTCSTIYHHLHGEKDVN